MEIGSQLVLASRISYVGDLGWELYVPMEQGRRLWEELWEAGQAHGLTACGMGVYGTTGRIEKGYRAYGAELDADYDIVEADMAPARVKAQDFVGRAAVLRQMAEEPARRLCTLTVDDHTARDRRAALHAGAPADRPRGRQPDRRRQGPPVVCHLGREQPVDRQARAAGVPAARAWPSKGERLFVRYFDELYPVTVAVVGSRPLFDPENLRVRA